MKIRKHVIASPFAVVSLAIFLAPISAADPAAHLRSEIDAARSTSGCPALQLDPVLNNISQRIARETADYVKHTARFLPTNGENDVVSTGSGGLSQLMRESGFSATKAKLLAGYGDYRTGGTGDNESKAIKGTVLEGLGLEVLPDCGYVKYGLSAISDDGKQGWPSTAPKIFTVTTVVLAGG